VTRFKDGDLLDAIYFSDGLKVECGDNAKTIQVVMENGQMDTVPWAVVEMNNGRTWKYNLALCESVQLKQ